MNGRGVNPSIWVRLGAVGQSSPQLKLSWQAGGGPDGMEGPLRRISGARGRGGLPGTTTSLGAPRARLFATGVSRKHIFSAATWRGEKPKHVDLGWPQDSEAHRVVIKMS